jgi:branched-chain amino acid transport system ATP-binding protein
MFFAIRDLHAGYGSATVLHGIELDVQQGEMVALVGANGAGKSTLLKVISGLLRQSAGTIEYEGAPLPSSTAARVRAGIAQVPEGRQVFADLTIEENLRLGAYSQMKSITDAEMSSRLEEVCTIFPILKERMKGLAGGLSGGQQQMLSIGRGLMAKPRLMLLDEPSLGLSPTLVTQIFKILVRLRTMGVSILLAEQNARMSLAIADRGYVIETGKIALSGTGQELLHSDEVMERYLGVGADETHGAAAEGRILGEQLRAILTEKEAVA